MIKINLVSPYESKIDAKVNEYVNKNLKVMIEVYREYLNENDGWSIKEKLLDAFPRAFIVQNDHIEELIEELYEIIYSHTIRDYIKPKYEATLYYIIKWWIDITKDQEDNIPIKLDDKLLTEIIENEEYQFEDEGNIVLEQLNNIENYLIFCFEDHDFTTSFLADYIKGYLENPLIFQEILNINLDEYLDLMPVDMKELYLEKKRVVEEVTQIVKREKDLEEKIIKEIYFCCDMISSQVIEHKDKSEIELSNEIFGRLKRLFKNSFNIEIEREAEIGHSKKKLGENDFYLYQNDEEFSNIAIGENKVLEKFNEAYGQLLGYLNPSFKFGFTVSISRDKTIREAYDYIINQLEKKNYEKYEVIEICEKPFGNDYMYLIKSTHIIPEDIQRCMGIYHIILDLNDKYRQDVAIEAREGEKWR